MINKPRGRLTISDDDFIKLYSVELVSVQSISDRYGVARQTVWHRAKRLGLTTYKRKTQRLKCLNCGETYERHPSQGRGKYCCSRCYFEATSLHGNYSRSGQRQGRKVAEAVEGEIVHHVDGNTFNNVPANLVIFRSHAQHCAFHKSGAAAWLKDKVSRRKVVLDGVTRWPTGPDW